MPLPELNPHPPDDYSRYLKSEEPLMLVGGQAVNLWALYYDKVTWDLAPFVSRDIDILGHRDTLERIAKAAAVKPTYFPLKPPSNEVGYVLLAGDLLIEVLRSVNGVTVQELQEASVVFAIGPMEVEVRVPSPVFLLKAKLANIRSLDQAGRQDLKHAKILWRVLPRYLSDFCEAVRFGNKRERDFVNLLGRLLAIVSADSGRATLRDLGADIPGVFKEIPEDGLPKVAGFKRHQLPRSFPDSEPN